MNKRSVILVILAIVLGGWWVYAYSGLFASPAIEVIYQLQPPRRPDPQMTVYPVSFGLNRDVTIRSLEVRPAIADTTTDGTATMWHLVDDPQAREEARIEIEQRRAENPSARMEPMTTRAFVYGRSIRGLKQADPDAPPKTLEPDVTYVLTLQADEGQARIEFQTRALPKR